MKILKACHIYLFLFFVFVFNARADYRKWYNPIKVIDDTQSFISDSWSSVNYGVDSFFANEDFSDAVNRSYIRLGYGVSKFEGGNQVFDYNLKIKVDFPNSKKKFKIVFESSEDDIEDQQSLKNTVAPTKANPNDGVADSVKETKYNAAVRSVLNESKHWKLFLDMGMRLNLPFNPFIKQNTRRTFEFGNYSLSLVQRFHLFRQAGFEEISDLNMSYEFSDTITFDLNNSLAWTDNSDKFTIFHSFSIYHKLSEKRALHVFVSTSATTYPVIFYDQYTTGASYRQLLHKNWLFAQLGIGTTFPKASGFKSNPYIELKSDVIF